jgi:pimeloyl-ACP methyl ester carboxylesterase
MVVADERARLPGGRVLGWDERGDPAGYPVVACHGGLSCRLDSRDGDGPARAAGVRLVAPDRPGLGASDPDPGRSLLDWARDVEHLADHLGLDRFAVYGWSAGGVYALACAHHLPDRVSHVGLVAGTTDLSHADEFALLAPLDQRLTRLARERPRRATARFAAIGAFMALAPPLAAWLAARSLHPSERAELARGGGGRRIVESYREAIRPGAAGLTQDYVTYSSAWGFTADTVTVPVTIWQGTDDSLVVPEFAHRLAAGLPRAELRVLEGAGHLLLVDRWAELFTTLRG